MEPCHDGQSKNVTSENYQVFERMNFELPDYYVDNTTFLIDDPRNFDDKVSRMLSQLSSGEVVGLVASFMMCVIFSFLIWSQLNRCYKGRILESSPFKARSNFSLLSGILRHTSRLSLNDDSHGIDSPHDPRMLSRRNSQKDKMVATLLVQMRSDSTIVAEQEQRERLQLGGLINVADDTDTEKAFPVSPDGQTIVDLSASSDQDVLVNRSDLPPIPGGRVLAVIGARIVEDEVHVENEDARSFDTSATQMTSHSMTTVHSEMSGIISPLYLDETEMSNRAHLNLRLRHSSRGEPH